MEDTSRLTRAAVWLAGVGITALVLCFWLYFAWFQSIRPSVHPEDWGTFGDYVSGVAGTVISLATLIAVVFTLRLQEKELAATRKEMTAQAATLSRQQFESTFFAAMRLLERAEEETWNPGRAVQGRQAFDGHIEQLNSWGAFKFRKDDPAITLEILRTYYLEWYLHNGHSVAAFVELVIQLLNLIDRSGLPDRQIYANLLRAALSSGQKHLIFYHALLYDDPRRLKTLLERYALFNSLDMNYPVPIPTYRKAWFSSEVEGAGVMFEGRSF